MTSLFHSLEFCEVTMNRFGTVIDKGGRLASLELTNYVYDEARRNGWGLVDSNDRDIGMVWQSPKT
jgi:hypothetical protein